MKRFKRLYVEITNVCNLRCAFCPPTGRAKAFMSPEQFEEVLRQAQPYSDHVYLHVRGEPLLHPDLVGLLDLCGKYGFRANITTNGTLLGKVGPSILGHPALRQVNISLHALEENSLPQEQYLQEVLEFALRAVRDTQTAVALRLWNLSGEKDADLNRSRNRAVLDAVEQKFNTGYIEDRLHGNRGVKIGQRLYLNHGAQFEWPSLDMPLGCQSGSSCWCPGLLHQLGVLADGTVIPCCLDAEGVINLGNLFKTPLEQILAAPRAANLLDGFYHHQAREELCKRCTYKERFL